MTFCKCVINLCKTKFHLIGITPVETCGSGIDRVTDHPVTGIGFSPSRTHHGFELTTEVLESSYLIHINQRLVLKIGIGKHVGTGVPVFLRTHSEYSAPVASCIAFEGLLSDVGIIHAVKGSTEFVTIIEDETLGVGCSCVRHKCAGIVFRRHHAYAIPSTLIARESKHLVIIVREEGGVAVIVGIMPRFHCESEHHLGACLVIDAVYVAVI